MKQIIICTIFISLAFLLSACNGRGEDDVLAPSEVEVASDSENAVNTPQPSKQENVTSTTPPIEQEYSSDIQSPEIKPSMSLPEYPIIDGSSSTVTMDAAIRAYLTDAHIVDQHSQTYVAIERLVPGNENPADVLLAVKYYDETLQDVAQRGADLVITPIAKEGFVFIVSADNPIDSLTQQQIKDIYSGKITNWK
ncbi:MAG: substrate-binding domain-containing protein, partial [Lachnospiraceae bacterium]|nr:substrate-binding domain-containing protein [Lachnospiraceae bacterium]